jgi:hypothetical protein
MLISWFAIGNYYIFFKFMFRNLEHNDPFMGYSQAIFSILNYIYISCMLILVILAFGKRYYLTMKETAPKDLPNSIFQSPF